MLIARVAFCVVLMFSSPAIAAGRAVIGGDLAYAPRILYDASGDKFRVWYHKDFAPALKLVYRESTSVDIDGNIRWGAPTVIRSGGIPKYGTHVIDEGLPGPQRFKNAYHTTGAGVVDGVHLEGSADGINWTDFGPSPVFTASQADDIVELWKNPLTGSYGMFVKRWSGAVGMSLRQTYVSTTNNLLAAWPTPTPAFVADGGDSTPVATQFYGAAGPIVRDGVMVWFLRMLRDDIARGVGYTVLAWSRDGKTFSRAREPFLSGCRAGPDEAMAWVYGATERNGVLYLSYSAYDLGHKVGHRSAMLAKIPGSALKLYSAAPMC